MKIDKKKVSMLFTLTLLTMALLFVNMNVPVKAPNGTSSKYLHEEGGLTTLHLDAKAGLISLTSPKCTLWHELYPNFCIGDYHLTSWEDTNGNEMLSPCDQIDMMYLPTEEVFWYHVDRVMVTLNLTRPEDQHRIYVEYNGTLPFYDPIYMPVCTKWHEVYPKWCNMYHIVGIFSDNPPTGLSESDLIDIANLTSPLPVIQRWHVEKVSTDMIVTEKNTHPVCTQWHELYPTYSNRYHLTDWIDNHDGVLSPCDYIELTDKVTQESGWYHVDEVTVTLNLTLKPDLLYWIMIEFEGGYPAFWEPIMWPKCTYWHEVYPRFSQRYHLTSWEDNGDGILSECDQIDMENMTGEIPVKQWWHVEEVSKDIVVTSIPSPSPMYWKPEYPDYAPSGMPDFDQKQDLWNQTGWWTWCAPTAVANSLWWMDSRFEKSTTPPPTPNDTFPLVKPYGFWDDHDPLNVMPFISHLAWLMDTDGQRTKVFHRGTWTWDMETGIAQYLSWSGVNPLGDVNGDGIVNMTDWHHVNAVLNGTSLFDIAADIWPETVTGPYTADNLVNQSDLDLVENHMGETGMFYERTWMMPDFYEIEAEVERCEDVILVLGFWYNPAPGVWERAEYPDTPYDKMGLGHAVTVAGINSTSIPPRIAISDPGIDAFEAGLTPGRSPVPHPYPHNSSIHNNASLVSHDIYNVTFIAGCPGGTWALQGYKGDPKTGVPPGSIAVVEAAVITSPLELEVCGVDITNVITSHCGTLVNTGYPLWTIQVNVTVHNNGTIPINCTVNAYYYNATITVQIGTPQNIINLAPCNTITLTFNWYLLGLPVCKSFTVKANATCICGASDEFLDGLMKVKMIGDIDGTNYVDWVDLGMLGIAYETGPGNPNYNPEADFDGTKYVDWVDQGMLGLNYETGC